MDYAMSGAYLARGCGCPMEPTGAAAIAKTKATHRQWGSLGTMAKARRFGAFHRRHRPSAVEQFLAQHGDTIRAVDGPIVLFAGAGSPATLPHWLNAFRERLQVIIGEVEIDRLDGPVYTPLNSPDAVLAFLTRLPTIAAIVDETSTDLVDRLNGWQKFILTLGHGGHYISLTDKLTAPWDIALATLTVDRKPAAEARALQEAAGSTVETAGYTITAKNGQHWFKLKDENVNHVLPRRNPELQVEILEQLEGGTYVSDLVTVQHGAQMNLFGPDVAYNPVWNRVYHGPIVAASHMLAYAGNTILPPSFRHPRVGNVPNPMITGINREYATIDPDQLTSTPLEGRYYDLSSSIPGHFGHIMTETVPKLWGWDAAKAAYPDLKVLYRLPDADYEPTLERILFRAYGIAEADVHWGTSNVEVKTFASPSVLWQNAAWYHFHPRVLEVWQRLREALVVKDDSRPKNVFISRKHVPGNRACRNVEEVEASFSRRGFVIIHPETLPFEEQVNVFANAENIGGFAGSGMFNMLFTDRLKNVIVLTHESYTARNEHLYALSTAKAIHYFWSPSDIQQPKGGFSNDAFHSPWEFDYDRNGDALDELLSTLSGERG